MNLDIFVAVLRAAYFELMKGALAPFPKITSLEQLNEYDPYATFDDESRQAQPNVESFAKRGMRYGTILAVSLDDIESGDLSQVMPRWRKMIARFLQSIPRLRKGHAPGYRVIDNHEFKTDGPRVEFSCNGPMLVAALSWSFAPAAQQISP